MLNLRLLELSNCCEQLTAATASKALLGSLNDLILKRFIQVTEVVTVSGYADDQFLVFLRVLLSFDPVSYTHLTLPTTPYV